MCILATVIGVALGIAASAILWAAASLSSEEEERSIDE